MVAGVKGSGAFTPHVFAEFTEALKEDWGRVRWKDVRNVTAVMFGTASFTLMMVRDLVSDPSTKELFSKLGPVGLLFTIMTLAPNELYESLNSIFVPASKPRCPVAIVTGVPGTGKSTILEKFKELNPGAKVVSYGDEMVNVAMKMKGAMSQIKCLYKKEAEDKGLPKFRKLDDAQLRKVVRSKLSQLDSNVQSRIGLTAAKNIARFAEQHVTLVDTHAMIKGPGGTLIPGIPSKVLEVLKPKTIVEVTSDPSEIVRRRQGDNESNVRIRTVEDDVTVDYHQKANNTFIISCAQSIDCTVTPLRNEGSVEEVASRLATIIKRLMPPETTRSKNN